MNRVILPCISAAIVVGLGVFAWIHRSAIPVLNPQGPIGLAEKNVMLIALLLPGIVVIPVFAFLAYFAWKYRATGPAALLKHQPNWDHDSWLAEALWWLVPTIIIGVLSLVAVQSSRALDPYKELVGQHPPITIQVVALDWKWLFIYPEQGIATVNTVVLPVNTPVRFELTADAPMNSFWIPSLGGQIMVMPGMQTQLNLMASKTGTFDGRSANISGTGFASMNFSARAVNTSDFDTWVTSTKQSSNTLSSTTYASLRKRSQQVPPLFYSAVDPELYNSIMMSEMGSTTPI